MRRQIKGALVAAAMFAGALFAMSTPASGVAGFGDVGESEFYTNAVQWMVDNGITTGTSATCFSPGDPVTRGQAAAFMWRMEGEPSAPAHSFTDVAAGYQQQPVSWMAAESITTGTSPTTFAPDDQLTRGQLAALLHRLAGNPTATGHPFNDISTSWQQTPVAWMVDNGITTGTSPTTFAPNDTVTRGQLATFFHRYKDSPAVVIDSSHPTSPACTDQVAGPPPANPGDAKDCADFATQADAQVWFDTYFPHYGDIAGLDADNDGTPCEPYFGTTTTTTTSTPSNCHPAYTPCIPNLSGDALNCGDLSSSQKPVTVINPSVDPYNLDGDGDGQACTS